MSELASGPGLSPATAAAREYLPGVLVVPCVVQFVTLLGVAPPSTTHACLHGAGSMLSVRSSSLSSVQFRGAQAFSLVSTRMAAPVAAPGEEEEEE